MPDLSPNPSDETNTLLRLLVMRADNDTLTPADLAPPFTANPTSVVVNCLLYASLSCSLLAAVGAMMAKEWLQSFDRTGQTGPVEEPLDEGGADIPGKDGEATLDDAPTVRKLRAMLSEDRADEEFEVSLESLLDRLDRELSQ